MFGNSCIYDLVISCIILIGSSLVNQCNVLGDQIIRMLFILIIIMVPSWLQKGCYSGAQIVYRKQKVKVDGYYHLLCKVDLTRRSNYGANDESS